MEGRHPDPCLPRVCHPVRVLQCRIQGEQLVLGWGEIVSSIGLLPCTQLSQKKQLFLGSVGDRDWTQEPTLEHQNWGWEVRHGGWLARTSCSWGAQTSRFLQEVVTGYHLSAWLLITSGKSFLLLDWKGRVVGYSPLFQRWGLHCNPELLGLPWTTGKVWRWWQGGEWSCPL